MMILRILALLGLVLCSCAGPMPAGGGDGKADVTGLVEAERSFARVAAERGTRAAFLEYLTEEAVIFRPRPVRAHDWYMENTQDSGILSWEPDYAEISASGDMGYTTGPWEFRQNAGDAKASSFGHYVTIWERLDGGTWRVVLDLGNVYDRPFKKSPKVETRVASGGRGAVDTAQEREVLLATESVFSDESKKEGLVAAYMAYTTDDVRYYRMGARPVKGQTPTRKALEDVHGVMTWKAEGAGVSEAGDLGYTYGMAELKNPGAASAVETSSYMRIWRIESGGRWSLALDIMLPSGPAQAPEE